MPRTAAPPADDADVLAALIEGSPEGVCVFDAEWRYVRVNRRAEEILRTPRAQLLGRRMLDVLPDFVRDPGWLAMRRAIDECVTTEFRFYWPPYDAWLDVRTSPATRVSGGDADGAFVYFQDVSARVRAEVALRESDQRLNLAEAAAGVGPWELDPVSNAVCWGEGVWNLIGVPRGSFQPTVEQWHRFVHPDDVERAWRTFAEVIDAGRTEFEQEFRIVRADGQVRWLSSRARIVRDASGKPTRVLGINIDVTGQKRVERLLRASESNLRAIIDGCGAVVYLKDLDGQYLRVNRHFAKLFETDADSICGKRDEDFFPKELAEVFRANDRRAIETGGVIEAEEIAQHPDGSRRTYVSSKLPLHDADGHPYAVCGVSIDITALKSARQEAERARAEAEAAREEAERANRAKDQFLAVLSHELRTPLTPVLMSVAAMANDDTLPGEVRDDLAMIRRNIELETKLIDDLLDVTRIANGKLTLQTRDADAHDLIDNVLRIVRADVEAKDVRVSRALDADDARLRADPARLQQVFWNLVKNAVKFTHARGAVTVRTSNPVAGVLRVEVLDDGVGIDPAVLPRIFSAFEQGSGALNRQFGGLGLGLTISRSLVELHGGRISAQSEGTGLGARFVVELPLAMAAEGPAKGKPVSASPAAGDVLGAARLPHAPITRSEISTPAAASASAPRLRLLLVDDHDDTLQMLRRLLERRGFDVDCATGVEEALRRLGTRAAEVVVSDIGLPDGTGHDLFRRARAALPSLIGIAASGYGADADLRNSEVAGFAAHLTKPIDVDQLVATIGRVTATAINSPTPRRTADG